MNANAMADMAAAAGVKIFALHLKTPAGARETPNNHNYARKQYQTLTRQSDPTIGDLYVPIDAEDATAGVLGFGQVVEDVGRTDGRSGAGHRQWPAAGHRRCGSVQTG